MGDDELTSRAEHEALMWALARTADARRRQGRDAEAERLYRRALDAADEGGNARHPEVAVILTSLAALKAAQGDDEQADALRRRASEIRASLDVGQE